MEKSLEDRYKGKGKKKRETKDGSAKYRKEEIDFKRNAVYEEGKHYERKKRWKDGQTFNNIEVDEIASERELPVRSYPRPVIRLLRISESQMLVLLK